VGAPAARSAGVFAVVPVTHVFYRLMITAPEARPETALVQRDILLGARERLVQATVTVIEGPDLGLAFPLSEKPVVLGKSRDCEIVLTDRAVSGRHLEVRLDGSSVRLKDLGSTNGTYVGEAKVIESVVPAGSVVTVGRTRLHLRSEDDGGALLTPSSADHFGGLYGDSVPMRQVFAVLERAATRDVSVLLDGETGTGKELAARAVHAHSHRSSGPLVVLDCSAVAPELIESQLFGHRRGSFTGAMQDRAGVFESARGGTVFLDELDSLPLDLQPKLLRVIEAREVVRLGEIEPRPTSVRLVAACGRSPEEAVARGELRKDLYFRLAVVRVTLPALRDRMEDIPLLVRRLLKTIGNNAIVVEEGRGLDRLRRHPWMGNVRELRNVLERGLLLAAPGATGIDQLPLRLNPSMAGNRAARATPRIDLRLPYKEAKEVALGLFEEEYLRGALARNGANLSRTARDVGLTRHHLRKLLRRHRLIAGPSDP
jgi:DNA-binding NtrC family response regulator